MRRLRIASRRGALARLWLAAIACAAVPAAAQETTATAQQPPAASESAPADAAPVDEPSSTPHAMPVQFAADVQPILAAHCLKCHGPDKHASGLRLDAHESAARGGDSGKPVLGGTPQTNELLARVASSDRSYRMPKNAPPLSPEEIDVLRRWVEQGTPWPGVVADSKQAPFYERWLYSLIDWVDRHEAEYNYAFPYIIGFLVLNILLLVVLRCQAAYRSGRPWTAGRLAGFCKLCCGFKPRELFLVVLLALVGLALAAMRGHVLKIESQLAKTQPHEIGSQSNWINTPYGWPPKPIRIEHPKQVAGTYYRGNCERNAELFNGGNYLTAIFRVSVCDEEHHQLDAGQPLPAGNLFVRVEIERAPGTTDLLFSKELMASIMLVKDFYEPPNNQLKEEPARLETLEASRRWVAFVPIGDPHDVEQLIGLIYIYAGQVDEADRLLGTLHYGIQYDLKFADGQLSPESDLWMDSFGNQAFAEPQPPGKLPYAEWFGHEPLPVITGENTKDPKLLGVDQYIEEGLIPPGAKERGDQQPAPTAQTDEPPGDE